MASLPEVAASTSGPGPGHRASISVTAVVGFLVLTELTSGLIQGFVIPLVPAIGGQLGVTAGQLNLIATFHVLSSAVAVPIFVGLDDVYGHRKLLRIAVAVVTVGTAMMALAPNYQTLLIGRFLQGPLAALLPLEFAIVRSRLPERVIGSAVGRLMGSLTIGASIGIILAGVAQPHFGNPQHVLLIPVLLGMLAVVVALFLIPDSATRTSQKVDWPGVLLLAVALGAFSVALSQGGRIGWLSIPTIGAIMLAAAAGIAWCILELRHRHPMVDLRFIAQRAVAPSTWRRSSWASRCSASRYRSPRSSPPRPTAGTASGTRGCS